LFQPRFARKRRQDLVHRQTLVVHDSAPDFDFDFEECDENWGYVAARIVPFSERKRWFAYEKFHWSENVCMASLFTAVPVIDRILFSSVVVSKTLRLVLPFRMLDSSLRALRTMGSTETLRFFFLIFSLVISDITVKNDETGEYCPKNWNGGSPLCRSESKAF
jgi:hypothetical protein